MPLQLRVPVRASQMAGKLQRRWQDVMMGEARRASMADNLDWFWADQQKDGSSIQFYLEFRTAVDGEAPFYILIGEAVFAAPVDA